MVPSIGKLPSNNFQLQKPRFIKLAPSKDSNPNREYTSTRSFNDNVVPDHLLSQEKFDFIYFVLNNRFENINMKKLNKILHKSKFFLLIIIII